MPLLNAIQNGLNFVANTLPWTPVGRGILAAREASQMAQYRDMMMKRQQQEFDTEQQQRTAFQGMLKPGDWTPTMNVPVTPRVDAPNHAQAQQQLSQTDLGGTGTPGVLDSYQRPIAEMIRGLASAGQYGQAGQLLVNNAPQAPQWREETVSGRPGQRNVQTNKFDPFPQQTTPAEQKPPNRTTYNQGDEEVTVEWDGKQWREVARAPRYKSQDATSEPLVQVADPNTPGRTIYLPRSQAIGKPGPEQNRLSRALPMKAVTDLSSAGSQVQDFERLLETFKPEFGGNVILGSAANTIGRITGDASGQAQWWQDYQTFQNVIRNKLFGSALTTPERIEFEKAMITPRMASSEIQKNLARQRDLATRAARKLAQAFSASGYDTDAIEGALGFSISEIDAKAASAPTLQQGGGQPQPSGGLSPEEQRELEELERRFGGR